MITQAWAAIAPTVLEFVAALLGLLLSWVLLQVRSRLKASELVTILDSIETSAQRAVREQEQTLRKALIAASDDGKLSAVETAQILTAACASVRDALGPSLQRTAERALGSGALDRVVRSAVEAAVHRLRGERVHFGELMETAGEVVVVPEPE